MRGQLTTVALAAVMCAVVCAALASCTSAGSRPPASRSSISTAPTATTPSTRDTSPSQPTSSPPADPDPRSAAAIAAYLRFAHAVAAAEEHPPSLGSKTPPDADFGRWSYDPFEETMSVYIASLSKKGLAYRGVPVRHRVHVRRVDLEARPYSKVLLEDCPTDSPSWHEYVVATGRVVPYTKPAVKPPYLISITMIRVNNHWGATRVTPDTSKTCSG